MQEIDANQIDPKYVKDKLTKLENRSRRNNLRIDGIKETEGETWNDCEEKFQDMFEQKLGWDAIKAWCAHRLKRNNRDSNTNRPQTIAVNCYDLRTKQMYISIPTN